MSTPAVALTGRWRVLRVGLLGGVSLLLAVTAHLIAGGTLPAPGVLAVLAVLLGLAGVLVTARRCRLPLLAAVLGIEQAGLHLVLDLAARGGACVASAHHATACMPGMVSMGASSVMISPAMITAHGVAVLATAWLLSRGEAWLWGRADAAVRTASATLTTITDRWQPPAPVPVRGYAPVRVRAGGSRGPPAGR